AIDSSPSAGVCQKKTKEPYLEIIYTGCNKDIRKLPIVPHVVQFPLLFQKTCWAHTSINSSACKSIFISRIAQPSHGGRTICWALYFIRFIKLVYFQWAFYKQVATRAVVRILFQEPHRSVVLKYTLNSPIFLQF